MIRKNVKLIVQILILFQCFNFSNASKQIRPPMAPVSPNPYSNALHVDESNSTKWVYGCIIFGQIGLILFSIFYCCCGCYGNNNNEEEKKQQPPINSNLSPHPLQAGPLINHQHLNYKKNLKSPNNNNKNAQNNNVSNQFHYPAEADLKLEAKKKNGCCCILLKLLLLCCKSKNETTNIVDSHDINAELTTTILITTPKTKTLYQFPDHQQLNCKNFQVDDCIKINGNFCSPKGYQFYIGDTYKVYAKSKDSIVVKIGHPPNHQLLEIKQFQYHNIIRLPQNFLISTNQLLPPEEVNEINTQEFHEFFQSVRQSETFNHFLSSNPSINLIKRNSHPVINELYSGPKIASLGPDIEISDSSSSNFL